MNSIFSRNVPPRRYRVFSKICVFFSILFNPPLVVKFSHFPKVECPFSLHEQWQLIGEGIHPQECIRKRIKKTCKCGHYAMLSYVVYVVINKNYMMLGCEGTGW